MFGVFLGFGSYSKEVKLQEEMLAGFPTLLACGGSRKRMWRSLIHCGGWLPTTLLQIGGRNGALGREGVPAFGSSLLWTGTAVAAKSGGERLGCLLLGPSE